MTDAQRWSPERKQVAASRQKRIARYGAGNDAWKALGREKRKPEAPARYRLTLDDVLRRPLA